MQILLAIVFGAVVGVIVHFALPHRDTRGIVVAPIVAASVAAVVWAVATWAGLGLDNPWIWIAPIAVSAIVTVPVLLGAAAARARHDARERVRLRLS